MRAVDDPRTLRSADVGETEADVSLDLEQVALDGRGATQPP